MAFKIIMYRDVLSGAMGGASSGMAVGGPVGAAIGGLLGGGLSYFQGRAQKNQGNDLLNANPRPIYHTPNSVIQAASEGLPAEQYAKAMKDISDNQLKSVSQAQDVHGALQNIASSNQIANNSTLNLDVQNAMARARNQQIKAQYDDKEFEYNQNQPYQRNYNYAMNLLGAGNTNMSAGIDKGIAGVGQYLGSSQGQNFLGGMFGGGNSTPDITYNTPRITHVDHI